MNIGFTLNVFGWQIGTFAVRIDIDAPAHVTQPVVDRGVKRLTRWWTEHMAS